MRTIWRTTDPQLVRDVGALGLAAGAVGLSFGAIAVANGIPIWLASAMSVLVFAGGSQFLAVGLLAAGGPVAAVVAGLLLNARHLPFGLALGDTLRPRWRDRLIGAHLMIDESVAFAMARSGTAQRRRAYWLTGGTLFVTWNLGTVLGGALGSVGDPMTWGLDAAFPAGLLALLLPSLRDPRTRAVAMLGALIAVVTTPWLPAGLPVLLALTGLAALAVFPCDRPAEPVGPAAGGTAGATEGRTAGGTAGATAVGTAVGTAGGTAPIDAVEGQRC